MFPAKGQLTICFAHVAYQFQARFAARTTGIASFEVRNRDDLVRRIGEADVLILSLARKLPEARDNQAKHFWRGMIGDLDRREDELGGKTLLIVGLGRIGGRLAQLAKAFDLRVIGIRRDPTGGANGADEVHGMDRLGALLPQADFVALTCPLTKETEGVIGASALGTMKPSAFLINVARGRCVDEAALVAAMRAGLIA